MTSFLLPPATKLGQGNIFRSVCQEFCPQRGGWVSGQTPPPPTPPPGADIPPETRHLQEQTPPPHQDQTPAPRADTLRKAVHAGRYGQQAGGTHPTGMHTCS